MVANYQNILEMQSYANNDSSYISSHYALALGRLSNGAQNAYINTSNNAADIVKTFHDYNDILNAISIATSALGRMGATPIKSANPTSTIPSGGGGSNSLNPAKPVSSAPSTSTGTASIPSTGTTTPNKPVTSSNDDQWTGKASGVLTLDKSHPLILAPNQVVNEVVAAADLKHASGKEVTGSQIVNAYLYGNGKLITQVTATINLDKDGFGQVAVPIIFNGTKLGGVKLTGGFDITSSVPKAMAFSEDPLSLSDAYAVLGYGANKPNGTSDEDATQIGELYMPTEEVVAPTVLVDSSAPTVSESSTVTNNMKKVAPTYIATKQALPTTGEAEVGGAAILYYLGLSAAVLAGGFAYRKKRVRKSNLIEKILSK